MLNQQSTIFPKQLKIDDYQLATQQNIVRVMQTSNLLLGNGGRTTNTAIIIAKCLHMLQQQNILQLKGKYILEFGSGVGLLGIYLGTIGVNVILTDLPAMKDMIQRNINLNRQILKGQIQFYVLNWKKSISKQQHSVINMTEKQKQQYNKSTSSSDISTLKSIDKIDYLLSCECGNIQDIQYQLKWLKKQNIMILGYMQRQQYLSEQFINSRQLQQYLLQKQYQYQRIQNYHPDYIDQRVKIYKIWRQHPITNNNNNNNNTNINNNNNNNNNNTNTNTNTNTNNNNTNNMNVMSMQQ